MSLVRVTDTASHNRTCLRIARFPTRHSAHPLQSIGSATKILIETRNQLNVSIRNVRKVTVVVMRGEENAYLPV
ncbi:MAG: hypothetical protein QOF74_7487 [Caballeronia mineralivorans]|jgi:hypothetical protein|nr:hypothetical protein [Caballeronia mineralivorans]